MSIFLMNVKQLQGDVDKSQDSEAMKKVKDAYERAGVRPCPPIHYSKPDLSLQSPPASRRILNYAPQLKNPRKPVSRSEMPCRRLSNLWKSPRLCVLCVSERLFSISSPQPYNICVDLTRHRSRVFDDGEDDRAHPKHVRLQDPCRDHC